MKPTLQVFHCPIEIAGQMGLMVRGLRQAGHAGVGYNTFHTYLSYRSHIINTDLGDIQRIYQQTKQVYDIFHYHFGTTIYPDHSDLAELRAMGKKLVMHCWGNDVRLRAKAQTLSPYLLDPCNPLPDDVMVDHLKQMSQWIDTAIIQDHELMNYVTEYYRHVHVLPLIVDVKSIAPSYPRPDKQKPLIIHAPTQPAFKGTAHIEAALERLAGEGYSFEYRRIEKLSHEQALRTYQEADLVIDQVLVGTYGTFAVEAMAFGKPVVVHVRPDLLPTFAQTLPIINADPVHLHDVLIPWISDPEMRHERGLQSRSYAEEIHDISKVVPQLLDIYRSL